jgi:hypothetical protein
VAEVAQHLLVVMALFLLVVMVERVLHLLFLVRQ